MAFSNDLSIDADHRTPHPHAHATGETTTLLGRVTSSSTTSTTRSSSRVSRFGLIGSLLAVVALSSSALVFLLNRGTTFPITSSTDVDTIEVQVAKAQRPSSAHESSSDILDVLSSPSSMTSSFHAFETSDHVQYYTYTDFSGGESGKPIHVISIEDYRAQVVPPGGPSDLGKFLLTEANDLHATILISTSSDSVYDVIEVVRDKLGCSRSVTDLDYCPVNMFNYNEASTLLSVKNVDDPTPIVEEYLDAPNGMMAVTDALADEEYLLAVQSMPNHIDFSDGELTQPDVLDPHFGPIESCPLGEPMPPTSTDGVYVLTIEEAEHKTNIASTFRTRLMNGKLPGPTIKVKRGQTFRVLFKNKLRQQEGASNCDKAPNTFCDPDYSNLHYHGGHVSGELPSDDVEMKVTPGGCYNYYTEFPVNHMPGTHWIHPHVHGSSTLQVGGGAALAMIVEDDPESFPIPPEVETANDVLLFVQDFEKGQIDRRAEDSFDEDGVTDSVWNLTYSDEFDLPRFRLVNGKFRPNLTIITGEWTRLRVVYGGWRDSRSNLQLEFDTNLCETNLLAKDGIYLRDYPRRLKEFPVPTAGRADIMIRCTADVKFDVTQFGNDPLMTIDSTGGSPVIDVGSLKPATENFMWEFPDYLQDVQYENVTDPDCSCTTAFTGGLTVNFRKWVKNEAVHTIEFGQLVERKLEGIHVHPYHQHVYPFQLTGGFGPTDEGSDSTKDPTHGGYFKNGDWHDNIRSPNQREATIKYRANVHNGKLMLHCHRLVHEDLGMMSQEDVVDNGKCKCNVNANNTKAQ